MNKEFYEYIEAFRKQDIITKQIEIMDNLKELIDFIENDDTDEFKDFFETDSFETQDEFLNTLFPYIIYLKELIGRKYL